MKKITRALVGATAAVALTLGGVSTAAMAYPPKTPSKVQVKPTGSAGKSYKVTGSNFRPNSTVKIRINGKTYTVKANKYGNIIRTIKLPKVAGKYSVTYSGVGEKTIKKTVTIGSKYSKATVKAKKITKKSTKKSTITLKGAKNSTVRVVITAPNGKKTTKTVKLGKKGTAKYTFSKATKKGTYKVRVTYKATSKKYGAKTYTTSFKKTR